jgi:hypothetical protein
MTQVGKRKQNYSPNDDYFTPRWIFEGLNLEFDLDVSSPEDGVPWINCKKFYSLQNDGLIQPWFGKVWMNPPFSKQRPWIEKFIEHGNGIALLPWSKSKSLNLIWDQAEAITMLPSNLKFEHKTDGNKGIFVSCGLFAFGQDCVEALKRLNVQRVR